MLNNDPIDGIEIDHDDKDMLTWKITITGLEETPYEVCSHPSVTEERHP